MNVAQHQGRIGVAQGLDQGGVAGAEPGEQVRVGRAAAQNLVLGRPVEHGVRAFGDVPGRPPVDVPGVPQQVLDQPGRARRYGRVQPGAFGRVREQVAVAAQCVDVFGDLHAAIAARRDQLSARRTSRACARSAG